MKRTDTNTPIADSLNAVDKLLTEREHPPPPTPNAPLDPPTPNASGEGGLTPSASPGVTPPAAEEHEAWSREILREALKCTLSAWAEGDCDPTGLADYERRQRAMSDAADAVIVLFDDLVGDVFPDIFGVPFPKSTPRAKAWRPWCQFDLASGEEADLVESKRAALARDLANQRAEQTRREAEKQPHEMLDRDRDFEGAAPSMANLRIGPDCELEGGK